jgi:hypothetical protein
MPKITRDAFIYLEPKHKENKKTFAQCIDCRMLVPSEALGSDFDGDRCVLHGDKFKIKKLGSCAFMVEWPTPDGAPNPQVVAEHAEEMRKGMMGAVTPKESGYVNRKVQCHRCRFAANEEVTECGLYDELNKSFPAIFALKTKIKPHGCCNAQEPKDER